MLLILTETDLYCFSHKTVASLIGAGQLRAAGQAMFAIVRGDAATIFVSGPVSPAARPALPSRVTIRGGSVGVVVGHILLAGAGGGRGVPVTPVSLLVS